MFQTRRGRNLKYLIRLLITALVLRSLIAPGYMISTSAHDGLAIIFCDGPVSIASGKNGDHADHHHHSDDPADASQEIHISPVCSHWSASGHFTFDADPQAPRLALTRYREPTLYQPRLANRQTGTTTPIRAPPSRLHG